MGLGTIINNNDGLEWDYDGFISLRANGTKGLHLGLSLASGRQAALASLLFDPPEPQINGKHSVSRLSYLFAHLHLLSSDSFSSLLLSSTLLFSLPLPISTFHLSILSEV